LAAAAAVAAAAALSLRLLATFSASFSLPSMKLSCAGDDGEGSNKQEQATALLATQEPNEASLLTYTASAVTTH
jgi:hypothetical protein